MPDTLLTQKQKKEINRLIELSEFGQVIKILDSVSTAHAGTAKTKDKRFVSGGIVKFITGKSNSQERFGKSFLKAGKLLCGLNSLNAVEIGANIIRYGYIVDKKYVTQTLYNISDHENWEVRESAAGALANILRNYPEFFKTLQKWSKDKSPRVRRAVVLASVGLDDKQKPANLKLAFKLLEPLLYDTDMYVKKNLGPFVLGGTWGRHYPKEFFRQLDKWIRIKDPQVRWNIAMSFNNSLGNLYPDTAMKYLEILKKDKNPVVQRAVFSTLRHLLKRNRQLKPFLP